MERAWNLVVETEHVGKSLVLLDLIHPNGSGPTNMKLIPYIKAIRDGTGLGLREAKEAGEYARDHGGVSNIPPEHHKAIIIACKNASLRADLFSEEEIVCLKVHDS
jgi:hypothetical protein